MANECNRDCFNCPYDDCVIDDASADEIKEINKRDSSINGNYFKEYYRANREYALAYQRTYYALHREERVAYQREYDRKRKAMRAKDSSICSRCSKKLDEGYTYSLCALCLEKKRAYNQRKYLATKMIKASCQ